MFLTIDNVEDLEDSREEAWKYPNVGLSFGSMVMVIAKSEEIVESVFGQKKCCKPIPRLEWQEATMLFLSKATPNVKSVSSLKPKERKIVERYLSECQFVDNWYL